MPTVSVVIPCFNGELFVAETINSVREQTFTDWELVVIDDGSTDDSQQTARRAAGDDVRIDVISQPNGGVATARMYGLDHTDPSSLYVIFLDADDMWYPDTLEVLIERIEASPLACASFGREVTIDTSGQAFISDDAPSPTGLYKLVDGKIRLVDGASSIGLWDLAAFCAVTTPGQCLIRRKYMVENGCTFDQSLSPCEDWDLWLQLSRFGSFEYTPAPVLKYRRHEGNASSRWERMQLKREALYAKNAPGLQSLDKKNFDVAYVYGMYGNDIVLCFGWSRESWRDGRRRDAARYWLRACRYRLKFTTMTTKLAARRVLSRA